MPLNLTRSLLTIILPGMVALGPWLLLAILWLPKLSGIYEAYALPFHVAAFGLAVVLGSAFEEVGSYFEKLWDRQSEREEAPKFDESWVTQAWYVYLLRAYGGAEPVVCRYLSRKVTALYFEFGMMCATPIALLAVALLVGKEFSEVFLVVFCIGALAAIAPLALWKSARHTHQLLCEVRHFAANPPPSVAAKIK